MENSSHLDLTSLVNKGFSIWNKEYPSKLIFALGTQYKMPAQVANQKA